MSAGRGPLLGDAFGASTPSSRASNPRQRHEGFPGEASTGPA